jgi:hypothetical protein
MASGAPTTSQIKGREIASGLVDLKNFGGAVVDYKYRF